MDYTFARQDMLVHFYVVYASWLALFGLVAAFSIRLWLPRLGFLATTALALPIVIAAFVLRDLNDIDRWLPSVLDAWACAAILVGAAAGALLHSAATYARRRVFASRTSA